LWEEDGCKLFRRNLRIERIEGKSVEEEWEEIEKRINEALKGTKKELSKEKKRKGGWWDEECRTKNGRRGKN